MRLCLHSISYTGMFYDGPALSIKSFLYRARHFGVDGVELDARSPHAMPYLLSARDRREIVDYAAGQGLAIAAIAARNDFSSPVIEHRDANIQLVTALIRLAHDLGAPVVRVLCAMAGSSRREGQGTYEIARPGYERAFPGTIWSERWEYCLDTFRVVAAIAEEEGVTLALQNHPPVVRNSADVLAMVHEVNSPNFKISFDISGERAWQNTEWVLNQARCIGDLWVHSHYGGEFRQLADGAVVRLPLGRPTGPRDGGMDWNDKAWVQAMYETGFSGYVSYEACTPSYLPNGHPVPLEAIDQRVTLGLAYMKQCFAQLQPGTASASLSKG